MVRDTVAKVALALLALFQFATDVEAQGSWGPEVLDLTYQEAFAMINSEMAWPCEVADRGQIDSPFGPRVYSTGRDDFHRGIDIEAMVPGVDEDIYAVYDGVVDGIGEYTGGGFYVRILHKFTHPTTGADHTARLHPTSLRTDRWYSLYFHMRDAGRAAKDDVVKAGDYIGRMGDTGQAGSVHLHLEVRLGTRCSLSYALDNPTSTCNMMNYDPHLNPLAVLPKLPDTQFQRPVIDQVKELSPTSNGEFFIRYHDDKPILNTILYEQVDRNGVVRASHKLDFNTREGYDASSTEALDFWDKTKPWYRPERSHYYMDYVDGHFVVPFMYACKKYQGDRYRITFDSIWGTEDQRWVFWFGESADEWDTSAQWGAYCSVA